MRASFRASRSFQTDAVELGRRIVRPRVGHDLSWRHVGQHAYVWRRWALKLLARRAPCGSESFAFPGVLGQREAQRLRRGTSTRIALRGRSPARRRAMDDDDWANSAEMDALMAAAEAKPPPPPRTVSSKQLQAVLKDTWGYAEFRAGQEEAVERLDQSSKKILFENRRMAEELRLQVGETDELQKAEKTLEEETKKLRREVALNEQSVKE